MNTEMTLKASGAPAAPHFPFSAIVGQEEMKRALIFNAIDPSIGGVLITGTRGTAKSTAARAMAVLLPEIEVVDGDAFNSAPRPGKAEKSVIVAYKTARAVAAFDGRTEVTASDVKEALALALAHRRRVALSTPKSGTNSEAPPSDGPTGGTQRDRPADSSQTPPRSPNSRPTSNRMRQQSDRADQVGQDNQTQPKEHTSESRSNSASAAGERVFAVGNGFDLARMISRRQQRGATAVVFGKGSFASSRRSGQVVRAAAPRPPEKLDLAIEATIRAAALDALTGATDGATRLLIRPAHWRHKQRRIRTRNLILLVVDASGSMAAMERMQAAKGAICSLLEDTYQRRDVVALIAFRGAKAEELLPPTRSAVFAYRRLAELPTGGRTPLAEGLKRARQVIERQARKGERAQPFLVVVTDGRATVPETGALEAALAEAGRLRLMQVKGLCIDMEAGRVRLGQARELARSLNATYTHI